ncbi:MAG: TonB-dependent receptor [Bryobacterales bacterium]|nr:TonB-dependent receptor [Bryobacterales bacterium]
MSRGGRLFQFSAKGRGSLSSAFVQDSVQLGNLRLALGLRYDYYRFLASGSQWQPRIGIAYHIRATRSVLRASYNRTYQTPPNENLLLSSSPQAALLAPPAVQEALGPSPVVIRPERQNVVEGGLQQALGAWASLDLAYYHKDGRDQQDNNNFLNTGVVFPISLQRIRVNGAEARLVTIPIHGISGTLSLTHSRAVSTPPFTGGLFLGNEAVEALSSGPFIIDHDQLLSLHGILQYNHRRGFWATGSIRYDSGLVSNPSDPQQVSSDPDYFDLLPYANLTAAVPRVSPRTITDIAVGYARKTSEGKRRWEVTAHANNIMNRTALYNFQSVFVGTRVVAPRTVGAGIRWYW